MLRSLEQKYGEHVRAVGITTGERQLRIYVNPITGTFTVAILNPHRPKILCIVAAGTDWHLLLAPEERL